jgi:hypothetical protein
MEHAQIKVFAMIPLDFVNAIMDLKDAFAKVKLNSSINSFINISLTFFKIGVSCPGGSVPCNGNGQCDLTNGHCICNSLTVGSDCSGNLYNHSNFSIG